MSNQRVTQGASRILSSQSLSLGSTSGTSTSVFGTAGQSVMQIRVAATQPVVFVVGDSPSVSSVAINGGGSYLPSGAVEYLSVAAGQRWVGLTTSTSATVWISECA